MISIFKQFAALMTVFIITCNNISAIDTTWTATYGGSMDDHANVVIQSLDDNYIFAGVNRSIDSENPEAWFVKIDTIGNIIWEKTYGGPEHDDIKDVIQTTDGGYAFIGRTYSYGQGGSDVRLVKTDNLGDTLWTQTYGGISLESCVNLNQTSDDGFIAVGWTVSFGGGHHDAWVIRTNSIGDLLWMKTYGDDDSEIFQDMVTESQGFFMVGWVEYVDSGTSDGFLVKTDLNGDTLWTKTYGGVDNEKLYSISKTMDGGYVLLGHTSSYGSGNDDIWLIKTDMYGDTLWTKTYGGEFNEYGRDIVQTNDGGFLLIGKTNSYGNGELDGWIIKTDENGNTTDTYVIGGIADDRILHITETTDGGYLIAGETASFGIGGKDAWIIKLTALPQSTNYALALDGVDDYIDFSPTNLPTGNSDHTIEAWVKIENNPPSNREWILLLGEPVVGAHHWLNDYGFLNLGRMSGGSTIIHAPPTEEWIHLSVTWNGENTISYINGSIAATQTVDGQFQLSNSFVVGQGQIGEKNWEGLIDELKIWNRDLTQEEILENLYNGDNGDGQGLVGYWDFNEGSGNIINDLSSNNNNGTIHGAIWSNDVPEFKYKIDYGMISIFPLDSTANDESGNGIVGNVIGDVDFTAIDRFGVPNKAAKFDGDNDLIEIPNNDLFNTKYSSLSLWIKMEAGGANNPRIISKGSQWNLFTKTTGELRPIGYGINAEEDFETVDSIETNEWHNLVAVKDEDYRRIYIDGELWASDYYPDTIISSTHPIIIGSGDPPQNDNHFKGTIDDIRIYNRGLSLAEIDLLYHDGGWDTASVSIENSGKVNIPSELLLHQNYPNPFNPVTTLKYDLPEASNVKLTIYNITGRTVKTLVNSHQEAGYKSIRWDATNNQGEPVSAGMYLYRIQAGPYVETKKMVLLK